MENISPNTNRLDAAQLVGRRFWAKVEKGPGCWLWTGAKNSRGYGQTASGLKGKSKLAHRASYEHFYGPIPDGLYVLHRCDVPHCVNPQHLFVGTAADNMQDAVRKGRALVGALNGRWIDGRRAAQPSKEPR